MEKLVRSKRRVGFGVGIALSLGALAGCSSSPNYSGAGNEFVVQGVVSDSEEDGLVQVYEPSLRVIHVAGKAATWFAEGKGQEMLSDEFDFLQRYNQEPGGLLSCGDEHYVGNVYDSDGNHIQPEQVLPGDVVEISGKIRSSAYYQSTGRSGYCTNKELAVYDAIRVIEGPIGPAV